MENVVKLVISVLIAQLYIGSGIDKWFNPALSLVAMQKLGISDFLIWPTAVFLIFAGVALFVGYQTLLVAAGLVALTVVATTLFHNEFADTNQIEHVVKNLAIIGGLLAFMKLGAGIYSVDRKWING
jgi:putative oxidoreductase